MDRTKINKNSDKRALALREKDLEKRLDKLIEQARNLTGVKSKEVAYGIVYQVATGLVHPKPVGGNNAILIKALEAIGEMEPKGPVQSMLATQMIATNEASARFLACSFADGHSLESRTANVNRAVRLMELYLLQVEAFEKLRGNSVQQKVVVEHVHVHEGGQAIVGAVTAQPSDRRVARKMSETPHEKRRGTLRNANPSGDFSKAPRCGAKNRHGSPCKCPAMPNGRCRLHGGLSTGPKTKAGIERIRRAVTKHGRYSQAAKAETRYFKALLKECRETIGLIG